MNTSFALGSLIVFVAASVAAQDYAIKIQQPLKVGQRYKLTVVASDSSDNSFSAQQKTLKNEKAELSVEMESEATVLAVDAKGRATKESHTIVKLLEGADKKSMLAAGAKVIASRSGGKVVFEMEGKPVGGTVAKALGMAVNITSGGPTDDEIFGTTERKKVGDRWPMNEALALKDAKEKLSSSGMSVSSVKGATTLQKVTKDAGVDVLHLLGNMTATLSPAANGPYSSVDSTMTATFTGAFPADITKSVREEGETLILELKASAKPSPQGQVVQVSSKSKRSITRKYKLLD